MIDFLYSILMHVLHFIHIHTYIHTHIYNIYKYNIIVGIVQSMMEDVPINGCLNLAL